MIRCLAILAIALAATAARAAPSPDQQALLGALERQARQENPAFAGFSPTRGQAFYLSQHTADPATPSCATCHGSQPTRAGRTPAGRSIEPMAASAAPDRYSRPSRVERWFRRECDQVLGRACTALEKGDFLSYMLSN